MIGSVFFPLVEAERHTANINMVVAMSAITSFLFISDTVFESYYLGLPFKETPVIILFTPAKVLLSSEKKREGFPKVEGGNPYSRLGWKVTTSG